MKVAFINQPWNTVTFPVNSNSIPIWTYETAKCLTQKASAPYASCKTVIYARRNKNQAAVEVHEGIECRRVSVLGMKLVDKMAGWAEKMMPAFGYLNSWLFALPYALRVALDLRRQQCDIVHIHNFSQFVPIIKAFNPHTKVVLHMHCEWLSQFDRAVIAKRLAQTDLVIGCSDYITNKVKAQFPEFADRCKRVFNGVDTEQFYPDQTMSKAAIAQEVFPEVSTPTAVDSATSPNIMFVGRLSPEKGLHTLIEAFSKLVEKFPAARLHVVGPHQPASAKYIADLSNDPLVQRLAQFDSLNYLAYLQQQLTPALKERVSFVGNVPHQLLPRYFQAADILVNPSVSESFGMSLVEAMASEVATVATAVGGMVDIVLPEETGLLVPCEDANALADAIARLLSDKALRARMGKAARPRAVAAFSWDAISSDLYRYYAELLTAQETLRSTDRNRSSMAYPRRIKQWPLRGAR